MAPLPHPIGQPVVERQPRLPRQPAVTEAEARDLFTPRRDLRSTVQWSCDFEVTSPDREAVRDLIRQFLTAGVKALHERYG
ncbi:hypothetical protein [Amycolatopsis sp. NPDC051372]|uniref:hypothetical protein n=1 Tax=Amycolatopsis sp. NPDC051372 TaxID=3155669 RepID=UPI0034313F84